MDKEKLFLNSHTDNESLCGFLYMRFRAVFHQYRSKYKFAVICINGKQICKSYTDSDIIKMEEQGTISEKCTESD